jgi:hypothetical protein
MHRNVMASFLWIKKNVCHSDDKSDQTISAALLLHADEGKVVADVKKPYRDGAEKDWTQAWEG